MSDSPAAVLVDSSGNEVTIELDGSKYRANIVGKVTVEPPPAPPGATLKQVAAGTPLEINADHDTEYVITNGKTFACQQLIAGAVGDPTEKGSGIEIWYYDGTAMHLVQRIYISGFSTSFVYPNIDSARDGTAMVGDGSTKKIIVRRRRLSGAYAEVDGLLLGYEI